LLARFEQVGVLKRSCTSTSRVLGGRKDMAFLAVLSSDSCVAFFLRSCLSMRRSSRVVAVVRLPRVLRLHVGALSFSSKLLRNVAGRFL
jgi:hypothetical protein